MVTIKKQNTLLLLATFILLSSACSKDDEKSDKRNTHSEYFTATIVPYELPGKTYIESGDGCEYCCWADNDAVNINGTVRSVNITGDAGSYTATIGADNIEALNGGGTSLPTLATLRLLRATPSSSPYLLKQNTQL